MNFAIQDTRCCGRGCRNHEMGHTSYTRNYMSARFLGTQNRTSGVFSRRRQAWSGGHDEDGRSRRLRIARAETCGRSIPRLAQQPRLAGEVAGLLEPLVDAGEADVGHLVELAE